MDQTDEFAIAILWWGIMIVNKFLLVRFRLSTAGQREVYGTHLNTTSTPSPRMPDHHGTPTPLTYSRFSHLSPQYPHHPDRLKSLPRLRRLSPKSAEEQSVFWDLPSSSLSSK